MNLSATAYLKEETRLDRARLHNKQIALDLVTAGIAVLVADPRTKRAIVKAFQRLDTDIPPVEVESLRRDFYDEHGFNPLHIGATKSKSVVRAMFRAKPDALPAISCGPSGLLVVDNDVKERHGVVRHGPQLFDTFCEPHGGLPEGAIAVESQGKGRHVYFANPDNLGCSAGVLKGQCETDVKAVGGYTIAPATIRAHDGKRYGTRADLDRLIEAYKKANLVPIPAFLRAAIGAASAASEGKLISEKEIRQLVDELKQAELPDGASLLDPAYNGFDIPKLAQRYGKLRDALDRGDRSDVRFNLAVALKSERPGITAIEFTAVVLASEDCGTFVGDHKPAQGEFGWRNIAKDFLTAKGRGEASPQSKSLGDAFGPVQEDVDDREAFIANGGSADRWDALQQQWADAREARKVRAERERADTDKGNASSSRVAIPFEMESDVAANATLPDWLVEEVVEAETLCVLYGAPNVGKSLALLDMLYHVAAGRAWHGRDTKKGCVLYVSVEGPNGTARRAKAWRSHHGFADGESLPLAFIRVDVDLFNDKKAADGIVEAVALLEAMTGLPCRAVALDTVNAVTPGMDENSSADVGAFLRNLRTILAKTNAAVLPVHHTGKDESRGMRGSNALLAKAETTLLVTDGLITTMKMRDGVRGQKFPFSIKVLNLWIDEKGRPVGAPVAVEPECGKALGAVEDEDVPLCKRTDTREDRVSVFVEVSKELAGREAANAEPLHEVGLLLPAIEKAFNARRNQYCALDGKLLKPLNREGVKRVASAAMEAGHLMRKGGAYFLNPNASGSDDDK